MLQWLNLRAKIDSGSPAVPSVPSVPSTPVAFLSDYGHLKEDAPVGTIPAQDMTLAEVIKVYLQERKALVESGAKTVDYYREARDKLADLLKFAHQFKREKLADLDAHFVKLYREQTLALPPVLRPDGKPGKRISPYTAKKRLAKVREFLEWAYRNEYLDRLPRNVDRHFVKIALPAPSPKSWTVEEVRELFKYARQRENPR